MNNPLVSIIIPTYNRAHLIGETLDSVLAQTYPHWECIVVDDGSTDNTEAIVNEYIKKDSRFQYHKRPNYKPKGANACRNYGFEISNGEFVNWVDSDDVFKNIHLEEHLKNFQTNLSIEVSISLANTFINNTSNIVGLWSNILPKKDIIYEMITDHVLWAIGAVVWQRDCVNENPFNENLASSQEWVFHLYQLIKKVKYIPLNEVTFLVRDHGERIGKDYSEKKIFSIFESRKLIFLELEKTRNLDFNKEQGLLKMMFLSVRFAIQYKYYKLLRSYVYYFLKNILKFQSKFKILKVIFISIPIYFTFGKGEKLFK